MFKFYLPLLEIFVACAMIYLIPEGLYKVAKRAFGQPGNTLEFLASNVRGFLIGSVVTLGFLFTFGISYEDFAANTVRNTASDLRRIAGFDPIDRCVARAKDAFRFTPQKFTSEASAQGLFPANGHTYTDREELLAHGAQALLLRQGRTPEEVYSFALREFCKSRLDRGMVSF